MKILLRFFLFSILIICLIISCIFIEGDSTDSDSDGSTSSSSTSTVDTSGYENRVINPTDGVATGITANFAPEAGNTWTFMIYLDADNNLESAGILDFQEMINGMSSANNDANMNLIVLMDRISGYYKGGDDDGDYYDNWTDTRLYQVTSSGYTRLDDGGGGAGHIANLGEKNMGDPATLSWFIGYCKTNFSADHYALVLWNHGMGARSFTEEPAITTINRSGELPALDTMEKGVCSDSTDSDLLYLDEVFSAVDDNFTALSKLDLIGFDACLMATLEVAYELYTRVNYLAGSMANEWGYGWDYNLVFNGMSQSGTTSPAAEELAKLIVMEYRNATTSKSDQTQSAVDLSNIAAVKTAVDNLAVYIYAENKKSALETTRDATYHFYLDTENSRSYPYYDLSDLAYQIDNNTTSSYSADLKTRAQNLVTAVQNTVVASYAGSSYGGYYGAGSDTKRGLSIFFSRGNLSSNGYSHYDYQWWYTTINTAAQYGGVYLYGRINFCNFDNDGTVETWKELMEAWYDGNNADTY